MSISARSGGFVGQRLPGRGNQRPVQPAQRTLQLYKQPPLPPPVPLYEVTNVATLSTYNSDSSPEDESEDSRQPASRQRSTLCRCMQSLIESEPWAIVVMTVIVLNTLVMALKCDYETWPIWGVLEDVFLAFFTVEVLFRLCVYRLTFFTDKDEQGWNIFDFLIVVIGVIDTTATWILSSMGKEENQGLSVLRTMRILRVLRSCRLLRHFKHLHMLVQGFLHSMQAVSWIAVLFISVVFVAGIICTTVVGQHAEEWGPPHGSEEDAEQVDAYFGSLLRSMITMFQMVTLDDWAQISGLVGKRSPSMVVFFIAYTLVTAFAMIALLTGVMTENVTSVSTASERQDEEKQFQMYVDTLESAFKHSSADMDEGLSVEEFRGLLQKEEVKQGMALHHAKANFSEEDLTEIFRSLDTSGDGKVSWEEFRCGLKYVQGPATARQVSLLRADVQLLAITLKGLAPGQPPGGGGQVPLNSERLASMEDQLRHLERRLQEAGRAATARRSAPRGPSA
mmetsp:Transcript_126508/g.369643  ORF Transcript_126508/g.369643 Transcript_126508/m.369643 type:complete len:508 (-) Transcript_126508:106-1629(-)